MCMMDFPELYANYGNQLDYLINQMLYTFHHP
jgi:hypothetical protein